MERNWTSEQRAAIEERGRTLLVSAAAGSGKTATLTERIISSLTDTEHPADLSRMLIVTFTVAAAGELRERISDALAKAIASRGVDRRLRRQLLLLPQAKICTVDSFCYDILRKNAQNVGLSPSFRVTDEGEDGLLCESVMEQLIEDLYDGEETCVTHDEFIMLAASLVTARQEHDMCSVLLSLYRDLASLPDSCATIRKLPSCIPDDGCDPLDTPAGRVFADCARDFADHYLPVYEHILKIARADDAVAKAYLPALERDAELVKSVARLSREGKMAPLRECLISFSAEKLGSLSAKNKTPESENITSLRNGFKTDLSRLAEMFAYTDEEWRALMRTQASASDALGRLMCEFERRLKEEKLRRAVCSFNDIEHYALNALVGEDGERTPLARQIADEYDWIYIDEYQDINPLQHKIFEAVSRPRNRFMVGDIKQSIYGFRHADPDIFASLRRNFPPLAVSGDSDTAEISMSKNFRSDRPVVDFVNSVFGRLFGVAGESIGYDPAHDDLVFGKDSSGSFPARVVLFDKKRKPDAGGGAEAEEYENDPQDSDDADGSEDEAAYIASEIKRTVAENPDIKLGEIAVLVRSNTAARRFADYFEAAGLPSSVLSSGDLFLSPEVLLALSLLRTIDNPRRDIPLAGALRSPIYGFTLDELIEIRRESGGGGVPLINSLRDYCREHPEFAKGKYFLEKLDSYRHDAASLPVDKLIWRVYDDTALLANAGSGGRRNLIALYDYARRFEASSFKGLYNFISYLGGIIERGGKISAAGSDAGPDTVNVVTHHSSKGLEFKVCFVANCAASFRRREGNDDKLLFDREIGCAVRIGRCGGLAGERNPLADAISARGRRNAVLEELRVYYVALTRAKERLYVSATMPAKNPGAAAKAVQAAKRGGRFLSLFSVLKSPDFISLVLDAFCGEGVQLILPQYDEADATNSCPPADAADTEEVSALSTPGAAANESGCGDDAIGDDAPASGGAEVGGGQGAVQEASEEKIAEAVAELRRRFSFKYPYLHLSAMPSKLSVSKLSPAVLDMSESDSGVLVLHSTDEEDTSGDEATDTVSGATVGCGKEAAAPEFMSGEKVAGGAEKGTATHRFLQFCDLRALRERGAEAELLRLREERFLSARDASLVRRDEVEAFGRSSLAGEILDADTVRRELRFNIMLPASHFTGQEETKALLADERLLVQGVIDCVTVKRGMVTLIDYKTDRLSAYELSHPDAAKRTLSARHSEQLAYYAEACRRMFGVERVRTIIYSLHAARAFDISDATVSC